MNSLCKYCFNCQREVLNREDIDDGEQEDEQPTIVVLKKGDLTHEEVERLRDDKGDLELDNTDIPGIILVLRLPKSPIYLHLRKFIAHITDMGWAP